MYTFLIILFVLTCILLVISILLQSSKGGGLASSFGGLGGAAVFGPRGATSFLQKTTMVLGILFVLLSIMINLIGRNRGMDARNILQEELNRTQQMQQTPVPVAPLPGDQETQSPPQE